MTQYAPDHRVTVRRRKGDSDEFEAIDDLSLDVISITLNKKYAQAAGGFQVVTTFREQPHLGNKRWDQLLQPDDVLHIELDAGDGKGLRSRMIGLVGRAARHVQMNPDKSVDRKVIITGMDFGKLLARHNAAAAFAPGVGQVGPEQLVYLSKGLIFTGTPADIVGSMYKVMIAGQLPWADPYFLVERLPNFAPAFDSWMDYNRAILESTGPVWSAMKCAANEPYNALTTETKNGRLHIILERYPFDPENKGKLTRSSLHEISEDDIRSEDLGVDDSDRVNYVWLKADLVTISQSNDFPLLYPQLVKYDVASIKRHGFQPFYPQTNFVPAPYLKGANASPDIQKEIGARAVEFWERNRYNHTHESGTLGIRGNPDIKAGDGIVLPATDMEYFVEGYTENYTWGVSYLTTLELSRGQKHGA
jgi:hypothetical protein